MRTAYSLFFLTLISTVFIDAGASEELAEKAQEQSTEGYSKLFNAVLADIAEDFKKIKVEKHPIAQKLHLMVKLDDRKNELNNQIWSKKISEEKKAILQREFDSIDKRVESEFAPILREYPIPILLLLTEFGEQRKKSKGKFLPSEQQFLTGILKLKPDATFGSGDAKINLACFKNGLLNDSDCVEEVMRACRDRFGSSDAKLTFTSLDTDLSRETVAFESADEAITFVREQTMAASKNELFDVFDRLMVGACGVLATEKYSFRQRNISFSHSKPPEWLSNLQFNFVADREDFRTACMSAKPTRRQNLTLAPNDKDLSEWVRKSAKSAFDKFNAVCVKFVHSECMDYEQLTGGDVAKHYLTVSCEVRAVTSDDVSRDVADWENSNVLTKADRLRHAEMLEGIRFCKDVREAGFWWQFHKPVVKNCKKPKK